MPGYSKALANATAIHPCENRLVHTPPDCTACRRRSEAVLTRGSEETGDGNQLNPTVQGDHA